MTSFELEYRKFERSTQRHKLYNKFPFKNEEVFGTPENENVDITTTRYSNMIGTIFNRNFGNTFHHQNIQKQFQNAHTHTGKQYQ